MKKHYVRFFYPGMIVSETSSKEIAERKVESVNIPDNAYGFQFYDREIIISLDTGNEMKGEIHNISGCYYPDGKVYEISDVEKLEPKEEYKIMLSNMKSHSPRVVKTRLGTFPTFNDNDFII